MKNLLIAIVGIIALSAYSQSSKDMGDFTEIRTTNRIKVELIPSSENKIVLDTKDESNVTLGPLNEQMAKNGEAVSTTKCFSCHKITDEKLVGPGWAGVTERRTAHWIMNFITNPDPMIDKDPEVQAQLELCLVRMPNQNLQEQEARDILEYMRQVDGVK